MRRWGSERFSNWAKVTQQVKGRARIPSPVWLAQNPSSQLVNYSVPSADCGVPWEKSGQLYSKIAPQKILIWSIFHTLLQSSLRRTNLLEGGWGGPLSRGSSSTILFRYLAHATDTLARWVYPFLTCDSPVWISCFLEPPGGLCPFHHPSYNGHPDYWG